MAGDIVVVCLGLPGRVICRVARLLWMASSSQTLRTEASQAWRAVVNDIVRGSGAMQNLGANSEDGPCPGHDAAGAVSSSL